MTNEDITAAYQKLQAINAQAGAAGLTEQSSNLWRGITGPTGPQGSISGVPRIGWSVVSDPASFEPTSKLPSRTDMMAGLHAAFDEAAPVSAEAWGGLRSGRGIPVTDEMIAAGKDAARRLGIAKGHDQLSVVYRAMAALAPMTDAEGKIDCLTVELGALKVESDHMRRELRETIADRDREILMLRAERDAWHKMYDVARTGFFGGDPKAVKADLPDLPRRPDGTLVPTAKPWGPPKSAGDPRRIGG